MYCINYVIKKGDTLYKISRQFNVSIDDIMMANPMVDVYNLIVDEVICIPIPMTGSNLANFTTYTVVEADTLGNVLERSNMTLVDFIALNDPNNIQLLPGSTVKVPIMEEDENEELL